MFGKTSYELRLAIEKITIRERYLALVTLAAVILMATQGLLMLTGLDNHQDVEDRIAATNTQIEQTRQTLTDYQAAINNPRVIALQASNADIQAQIDRFETRIRDIDQSLMSPDRMIDLLKELMERQSQLTITSINVLPVATIESNVDGASLFYQHGLKLTLNGRFEALTDYLASIEALDDQLFWDDLIIRTDNFPSLEIELNVHTLSQDEAWLNV